MGTRKLPSESNTWACWRRDEQDKLFVERTDSVKICQKDQSTSTMWFIYLSETSQVFELVKSSVECWFMSGV